MHISQPLIDFLNNKVAQYNHVSFIEKDPISIPHQYTKLQDIEIAGLLVATIAWGNRTSIIQNGKCMMQLMDNSPYAFVLHHQQSDLKKCVAFKHRTFNATDFLYFISFLHHHYTHYKSLEQAFLLPNNTFTSIENSLLHFHDYFFSLPEFPARTKKHVATPARKSACKRLNMYLRWMVRHDNNGVDFGLWKNINQKDLIIPLDTHVAQVACRLSLLPSVKANWKQALALTNILKTLDSTDPVKYDFALFSIGTMEKYNF